MQMYTEFCLYTMSFLLLILLHITLPSTPIALPVHSLLVRSLPVHFDHETNKHALEAMGHSVLVHSWLVHCYCAHILG